MYQIDIPPHVADVIRHLPPDIKKGVREALKALASEPRLGDPLGGDLEGLWKYRVRRYRIVFELILSKRIIRIYAVGHRREIYDQISKTS